MSKPCQIRVTSDGKYCCDVNHLTVRDGCIGAISFANLPLTLIELEVTPDTWIPASIESIEGSGQEMLMAPGEYRFLIDCSAYDGLPAPDVDPVALCYECCKVDDYGSILTKQLAEICEKLENPVAIETSFAQVGCIKEDGIQTGVVMACKKADFEGTVTGFELWAFIPGQEPIQGYSGPWEVCNDVCPPATARGVITSW